MTSSRSMIGSGEESARCGTVSLAQVALGEPAERAALGVDEQRVGDLGALELRPDLGGRLADEGERRLPEVDVGDAHQRQPLERAVGADEVLDEVVGGVHQELGGGRELREVAALLEDGDAVAHLDRLVDVVGDEEDRLADLGLEAEELVLQALAVDRVDRAEGLVHQHHRRVRGERAGDADALLLAARELGGVAVGDVGGQRDQVEQLGDAARGALPCPSRAGSGPWRCSGRSSGAGRGRSAGSRSRSRAAAARASGRGPRCRRSRCRRR